MNYWGYQPVSFFAPHHAYSSRPDRSPSLDEFRDMVKALHRAGIEVILDVVFNHTAEGGADGPTLCYRGLANDFYYILETDKARYADYSGCGNTLNANQPIVRRLIQDSLRYWVTEMHVDGFRFDLASILSRDENGQPLPNPPVLWDIESDPLLAGTKLIAEAWDAAGLYQVGSFVGDAWQEWNGRVPRRRPALRQGRHRLGVGSGHPAARQPGHLRPRGTRGRAQHQFRHVPRRLHAQRSRLVQRQAQRGQRRATTATAPTTTRAGTAAPKGRPTIRPSNALRNRQVKNFLTLNLLAAGTPMLLMGDEVRRTQQGNNNAYCQDNEISWFDWTLLERHADIHRFVKLLTAFRQRRDVVTGDRPLTLNELLQPRAHRMARRQAQPAGLGRALARARLHVHQPA